MYPEQPVTEDAFNVENIMAEEYINVGDFPKAAEILVTIIDKDPKNWRAYNNLGILSWTRKYWNDAFSMFLKSVTLNPVYVDALLNFFDAALKIKRIEECLPFFEIALQRNPELKEIEMIRNGIVEMGTEIYKCKRALEIGTYSALIDDAEKELENGNDLKAMELFLKANDSEGPSAKSFCGLGIISFHQNRFDDAFSLFLESIKLNPSDTDTFLNMLDAAKNCSKIALAKEVFEIYRKEFSVLDTIADEFEKA